MSHRATRKAKVSQSLGTQELRFDGRTLAIRVYINTDESAEVVAERLRIAAAGPQKRMVLIAGGELDSASAAELWKLTTRAVDASIEKKVDEEN